jgi:L-lactate dehydrogenase complex protein LldG
VKARGEGQDAPRGGSSGARGRILARIRSALAAREALPHPGTAPGVGPGPEGGVVGRFVGSLEASGGEAAVLGDPAGAAAWLRAFAAAFEGVAVGAEVPRALRPDLDVVAPERAGLGVSVALAGAAATGTLILSSVEGRALQLLPPVHLVWVEARSLHPELGEALEAARARGPLPAALALHSGPSKSADIGRILVTGVHGPGRLIAAVTAFPLDAL